ncbi:MAG: hypothetical protein NTZ48_05440, partial [Candidatus Omnitrophica bacterium]|nr:hypothetical protein [Candidatus Omnitrophota bacterium]
IAQIVFPISLPAFGGFIQAALWVSWYLARIVVISIMAALVEVAVAQMRLFRVVDFLGFAFVLGVIACVCAIVGI